MVRGRGEVVRAAIVNFSARRCCHKATRAPLPHCVISFLYDVTSQLHQFALFATPSSALTARSTECRSRCTRDNIPSHIVSLCSAPNDERAPQWKRHLLESSQSALSTLCAFTSSTEEPQFHHPGLRIHHQSHCHPQVSRKRDIQCDMARDRASAALFPTRARGLPPGRERGEAAHASQLERVSSFRGSSPSRAAVAIILPITTHQNNIDGIDELTRACSRRIVACTEQSAE